MSSISFVNALQDNYIWIMISDNRRHAIVVDPGESSQVLAFLQKHSLQLSAILLTHHHNDHCSGVPNLLAHFRCPVYGIVRDELPWITHNLNNQNQFTLNNFNGNVEVLHIPGHTRDHIAYRFGPALFCGDTLFTGGCGRLFEGSAQQMFSSLNRLSQLPNETRIYCGHEYTVNNLLFAAWVEPTNIEIKQRLAQAQQLRQQNYPTVPSVLKIEKQTNPFLRCHLAQLRKRVSELTAKPITDAEMTFAYLRNLKNEWRPI